MSIHLLLILWMFFMMPRVAAPDDPRHPKPVPGWTKHISDDTSDPNDVPPREEAVHANR